MPTQSIALSLRTYIWLADTIYSAGHITREEIDRRWARNMMVNPEQTSCIPERTFHKWRHALEDLFEIDIRCDRSRGGAYYIADAKGMEQGDVRNWLISTFAVSHLMSDNSDLRKQILFEQIPSGQRFLTQLIEAMRDSRRVRAVYHKFGQDASERTMAPYCVKVYAKRWYVLAQAEDRNEPRLYALDRFEGLQTLEDTYRLPKGFDAEAYFADRYGISNTDHGKPELIRLRVHHTQVPYLKTLPIHSSQRLVEEGSVYSIFELCLIANYEFSQELHKYGSNVEVLSPKWLRDEFAREAKKMMDMYKK